MSTKDDPRHTKPRFNIGDKAKVFDADTWELTGDIGDNSQFYKPAKVVRICKAKEYPNEWIADVIFDEDGRLSKSHFQDAMEVLTD